MARKKSKSKLIAFIIAGVILIVGAIIYFVKGGTSDIITHAGLTDAASPSDGNMYVNFIDIGQGDCTLITCKDTAILIDCGEYAEYENVRNYLLNKRIFDLDLIITTHPHTDHIGGMGKIMYSFKIGDVIMPKIPEKIIPTTTAYEKFMLAVSQRAKNVIAAEVGKTYKYGELTVQILGPVKDYDNLNNMSVVAKITYGKTSVMMTGDAQKQAEWDMLKNKYDFSAELLKVGHHGSKNSSSYEWFEAVKPEYAVISCGKNNDYGHPNKQTIKKLDKYGVQYFRTDLLGNIVFVSDGNTFSKADSKH